MTETPPTDPDAILFDDVYARSRGADPASVPWAHGAPHPMIQSWLATSPQPSPGGERALVVGSGLGDDAEVLAAMGWDVTAFDVSPAAIAWARERFPKSTVAYHVADVFDLPQDWRRAFDLVLEIHTVQALPVTRRQAVIRAIADTVAAGGELIVVTMTRRPDVPLRGRPWPLTEAELRSFTRYGFVEQERVVAGEPSAEHPGRVRCHLTRRT